MNSSWCSLKFFHFQEERKNLGISKYSMMMNGGFQTSSHHCQIAVLTDDLFQEKEHSFNIFIMWRYFITFLLSVAVTKRRKVEAIVCVCYLWNILEMHLSRRCSLQYLFYRRCSYRSFICWFAGAVFPFPYWKFPSIHSSLSRLKLIAQDEYF